jgi:hypothetical protein
VTFNGLPPTVVRFLDDHVASVAQLEVLLFLRAQGSSRLTALAVGRELRIDENWAAEELHALAVRGLLVEHPGTPLTYEYAPGPELGTALDTLVEVYGERRVSVISRILAKPNDMVRVFADAFRLRKD